MPHMLGWRHLASTCPRSGPAAGRARACSPCTPVHSECQRLWSSRPDRP